ncbi:MAG: hypothetical protein PHP46_03725, partial [Candidatus Omnitrophica bacterium]|nr:hypothetical protein [Candidatus Omnitrophota bacterium]
MFLKSIRFKVILWYMLFLMLTLLSFSLLLYGGFSRTLYGDFDDLLSSRALGIASSIETYWEARSTGMIKLEGNPPLNEIQNFSIIARNWVEEKRKDPELMSIFAEILDAKGNLIVASKSMPKVALLDKDDLEDISEGEDYFDTVRGQSPDTKRMKYRVYTRPVMIDRRLAYIVQVAGPTTLVSLALNNLVLMLFVLIPLTAILAGIPGVILVRLTLK